MNIACKFRIYKLAHQLVMHGEDDLGRRFSLTLDRTWAANLALELDDWLTEDAADPTV
jgi:hypothetical protein